MALGPGGWWPNAKWLWPAIQPTSARRRLPESHGHTDCTLSKSHHLHKPMHQRHLDQVSATLSFGPTWISAALFIYDWRERTAPCVTPIWHCSRLSRPSSASTTACTTNAARRPFGGDLAHTGGSRAADPTRRQGAYRQSWADALASVITKYR